MMSFIHLFGVESLTRSMFSCSSGTSRGEQKLIPMFEQELERRLSFFNYMMPRMKQVFQICTKANACSLVSQELPQELKLESLPTLPFQAWSTDYTPIIICQVEVTQAL